MRTPNEPNALEFRTIAEIDGMLVAGSTGIVNAQAMLDLLWLLRTHAR